MNYLELRKKYWIENVLIKKIIDWFLWIWLIKYSTDVEKMINEVLNKDTNEIITIKNFLDINLKYYWFILKEELRYLVNFDKNNFLLDDLSNKWYYFIETIKENYLNKLKTKFFDDLIATEVFNILSNFNNNLSFVVGWFIRDTLIWKNAKDIDFVTNISIEQLKDVFKKYWFEVKTVWEHFWVLMVSKNWKNFEIANFRKDLKNKWFWATEIEIWTFEDDFMRRDFNINSLYYNPIKWILLDPNKWFDDLINKRFKFIWNPEDRIREDVIRILRVFKFMKKGFSPSKNTLSAARNNFKLLCTMWNYDRIEQEIEKILFI